MKGECCTEGNGSNESSHQEQGQEKEERDTPDLKGKGKHCPKHGYRPSTDRAMGTFANTQPRSWARRALWALCRAASMAR